MEQARSLLEQGRSLLEPGRRVLVGPDPGTLSPEQLEQLRDFKVRESASPKTCFYQSEAPRV